jgi:hypothetical protein
VAVLAYETGEIATRTPFSTAVMIGLLSVIATSTLARLRQGAEVIYSRFFVLQKNERAESLR